MIHTTQTEKMYIQAWDSSYGRCENHLFLPGDEVIRFFARYLRRRISVNEIRDVCPNAGGSRMIDLGCGLGRNVLFGTNMGLEMYGNDLSAKAIGKAKEWLSPQLGPHIAQRLVTGDIRALPWTNQFFDHAICDSVLDSMPFEMAQAGVAEIARITKSGGYFYCSLISGDQTGRNSEYCDELLVDGKHEKDTVQSYFNYTKVNCLLGMYFEILDCYLIQVKNSLTLTHQGRWHVVSRVR